MSIRVELSSDAARRLRDEWSERLVQLQGEAESLEKDIAAINAQLNGQLQLPSAAIASAAPKTKSGKNKKGENARVIEQFLTVRGTAGASVSDIATQTSIPFSSCVGVLKKRDDIFAKGTRDGLWRVKPRT